MKRVIIFTLSLTIGLLFRMECFPQSFLGGEIGWAYIGNDSLLISLTVYTECDSETFDTAHLKLYCKSTGNLIQSIDIPTGNFDDVTPYCPKRNPNTCTKCSDPDCPYPYGIKRYRLRKIVVLDSSQPCFDLTVIFQQGHRPNDLTNGGAGTPFKLRSEFSRCNTSDNYFTISNFFDQPFAITFKDDLWQSCDGLGGGYDSIFYKFAPPETDSGTINYTPPYSFDKPYYFLGFPDKDLPFPAGINYAHLLGEGCHIQTTFTKVEKTSFAIEYEKHTNGKVIGKLLREWNINVLERPSDWHSPELIMDTSLIITYPDSLVQRVILTDDIDTADMVWLNFSSSPYPVNIPDSFWSVPDNYKVKHPSGIFRWKPTLSDLNSIQKPYYTITIYANVLCEESTKKSFRIKVMNPTSINSGISRQNLFSVYPNPGSGLFTLKGPVMEIKNITLTNCLGNLIEDFTILKNTDNYSLDIKNFYDGVYMVRITTQNGNTILKKLILLK
jgi:hypothetical protein